MKPLVTLATLLVSFAAAAAAPTTTTSPATLVAATTAQLNGSINPGGESTTGWFRLSTTNPGTCDDAFGTRVPGSLGTMVGSGAVATPYSVSTTGLLPGTVYWFCSIAQNASGTAFGAMVSFTTPPLTPTMTTQAATNVTSSSSQLNADANPNGATTTAFFRYSSTNPGGCSNSFGTATSTTSLSGNGAQSYNVNITGLLAGVTYWYCAIGQNSQGTTLGNLLSFTTLVAVPTVTTSLATSVTGFSAQLNGTGNPNGASATGWFRYASSDPGTCSDVFGTRLPASSGGSNLGSGSVAQAFAQSTGSVLTPGTTYYYCAIAQNSVGTGFGPVQTFTTPNVPTVTSVAATLITSTGATLNGSANPNGSSASGYYRYSPTNPGVCSDSFGTLTSTTSLGAGGSAVNFPTAIAGLLPGTTYYYCAIAGNGVGTGLGSLLTFTTPPALPIVATQLASLIGGTTAAFNGTVNPRGDASTGWFRFSSTNPVTCNDTFGTRQPLSGGTAFAAGNTATSYLENLTTLAPGTTYWYCAIAQNSVGLGFGAVQSFTTPNVPVVTTVSVTSLTGPGAQFNGTANPNGSLTTAWFRYATVSPGTCNDAFGTRVPASSGSNMGSGGSALSYAQSTTSLTPGTTYFYCAIAQNAVGTGFGAVLTFTAPAIPATTTSAATAVAATTATLNGSANPNLATTSGWFRYSTVDPGTCSDAFGTQTGSTSLGFGSAAQAYTSNLTGLLPGTTYYFCAIAGNVVGNGYGAVLSFTTPATAPLVTTSTASSVTGVSATLNGSANPRGAATSGYYRYSTTNPVTCNDTFGTRAPVSGGTALVGNNTNQAFPENLTGLLPGTTYYYCAIATNVIGTGFGLVLSFATPNVPTLTTQAASSITGVSATLSGQGTPNGAAATGYFRYSSTDPGACNDTFGTRLPSSGGTNLGSGASPFAFAFSASPLTPGTTYYYCAIATNLVGTGFGAVLTFSTPATPTVTTVAATSVTATAAVLNATAIPNGASSTGWFRYATVDPVTCNDTFGTRAPFSGGNALGAGASTVPYSVNPTALLPGTTYYYCAIAQNLVGNGYGAVMSFTTPPLAPSVVTSTASLITAASAQLNGSTNPNGAATTAWFRYDTVSPGACNDAFGTRMPASGGANVGAGNAAQAHNQALTGLALATTYYYCAIASNSVGTTYGSVVSFTTSPTAPSVTTLAASGVTTTQATLNAQASPNGAASTGWFRFSTVDPGTCNDTFGTRTPMSGGNALGAGVSSVPYSVTPTTLTPGTTYYFCAIAQNTQGFGFGAVLTFRTVSTQPTLNTLAATAIGGTTATLNGSANPNGDATDAWFRFDTVNPVTCNDTFGTRTPASGGQALGTGTSAVPFTQALTSLTPGTQYYFCAIAQNGLGKVFGLVLAFATPAAPTVTTMAASPVTATTATLTAQAVPNGTAATGWFRYSTTLPSSCDDTFGTRTPVSGGTALGSGAAAVPFSQAVGSLSPGTPYYFCAISSNMVGMSFGAVLSFVTPAASPTTTSSPATLVTSTTATVGGSANPNGATATGYVRYSTTNPGACSDTFGARAPSSGGAALGAGTSTTPFTQGLTGLLPGTLYYYCAIANNVVGTGLGSVLTFTTTAAPTVTTSAASSVATATATVNGSANPRGDAATGWFRYDTVNPGACNDTFGTRAPSSGGASLGAGVASAPFSQPLTGLSAGTQYWVCAIASNSVGTSFGNPVSFTTLVVPTMVTNAPSVLGSTSATLSGTGNPNGASSTGWFRYSTVNPVTCNDTFGTRAPFSGGTALGSGSAAVAYTANITGLSSGLTYWVCANGSNTSGTGFGTPVSFTTLAAPTVTSQAPTLVTTTSATLNGQANPNGAATTAWFRYSATSPGSCNNTFGIRAPAAGTSLGSGSGVQPFAEPISGLTQGTTYYFCAIAQNSVSTSLGTLMSFTTPSAPTVTTSTATLLTATGAQLNGSANPRSDATTGWFRYATVSPGTCNDTFGTRAPSSGGTSLGSGASSVTFFEAVTGLTAGTTYFFCAIAQNSVGVSYGSVQQLTTPNLPVVTTNAATSVTASAATLNGTANPSGAATTGYYRYSATDPGACDDTFGTRVPASGGTNLGAGSSAVNFPLSASGLSGNTTYYFCAIATNGVGTAFGTVRSFTTPAAPTVTTVAATAVVGTTATLNGTANPNGSTATGWVRYGTVNPVTCNDTFGTRNPSSGGTALGAGTSAAPYALNVTGLAQGTTYWFCAIASNGVGTSFGTPLSFTTGATPVTTTVAATGVSASGAQLNGTANPRGDTTTGFFRYATVSPGTCNNTFGTRMPSTGGTALGNGQVAAPYTETLSGLSPSTTYFYCALATNSLGTTQGTVMSFTTSAGPAVTTTAATAVTSTTATLNGSANPRSDATVGWFRYSATNPGSCNDTFGTRQPVSGGTSLGSGASPVSYAENLTGLVAGTTYYFCAVAQNSFGTSFGAVLSFIAPAAPVVTTTAATTVTATGATLNGSANPSGAATTAWVRYSTVNPGTCDDVFGTRFPATGGSSLGSGGTVQTYSQAVTGLLSGTTYYFCAVAQNPVGTSVGAVLSFATPAAPTTLTTAATAVTSSSATLNGSANPNGTAATGWFRYSQTSPGATCNDTFGTRAPLGTGSTALGAGNAAVTFSQNITGLTPGATYYVCAIAQNTIGLSFGSVVSFTATTAAPVVTTNAASAIGGAGATVNGSANPGGDATLGWFRYATVSPTTCDDVFGTRAPLGTGGTTLGAGTSPAGFSQALTGLAPGATYYFCAIAQNSVGTRFGTVQSFVVPRAPVVTTTAASSVVSTSATLNGSANPSFAATVAYFRYSTTSPTACDDVFGTRAPLGTGGTMLSASGAPSAYSATVSGLTPGTTYYFCAVATNVAGAGVGAVLSFKTPAAPTVMTSSASNVNGTVATLNGAVNPNGAATTGWFRYSTSNPGSCNDTFGTRAPGSSGQAVGAGSTSVGWSQPVTGLTPGATYYFCAIAQNSVGTSFGALLSFTLTAEPPVVMTMQPGDVDGRNATLSGEGNPNGTDANGWFRLDTTDPGQCNDTFGTRVPGSGGVALGAGVSMRAYQVAVTDLKPNTTYYYCAIASNAGGASFGPVMTFTTKAIAPDVVTVSAATEGDGSITLEGSVNPNGSDTLAYFRYDTLEPATCNDLFGTKLPEAGEAMGNGTEPKALKQNMTALPPGTYYFCAIATNSAGTSLGEVKVLAVSGGGCGCGSTSPAAVMLLAALALVLRRRRRSS